jgi:GT2 family glycosyltransferase
VFIILLNWNGWRDTIACVDSCRRLTWPNYRILVVDNNSSDGSEKFLRQHLREVEIIQSGSNLGFAGGYNVGIRHAISSGADYIWLLNNDTVVDSESLTALVEAMKNGLTVGIAGSKIYYHDDPRRIWFAGGLWEKGHLRLRHRGAHMLDEGQYDEMREVGSVSGCSMLVRSAAIKDIGLMDESYFLYWEDTEWCARAKEKGYGVIFVPESHVWHKVSASAGKSAFSQYYYFIRNGFYFLSRYDPRSLPRFIIFNLLYAIYSITRGNIQVMQGTAQGFVDFMRKQKGPRRSPSATGAGGQ